MPKPPEGVTPAAQIKGVTAVRPQPTFSSFYHKPQVRSKEIEEQGNLAHWLAERCKQEGLSARQTAAKTGLSHTTIYHITEGLRPSPETLKKLARGFSDDGTRQRLALEDQLLVLAGYRTPRPKEELSEPLARVIDKIRAFNEPRLKIIESLADFLTEIEGENQ